MANVFKMSELMRAIKLKMSMEPGVYYGPSMSVFPFDTRGMFRTSDYPLPPARYAGFKQEILVNPKRIIGHRFGLADGCFEAAPSTLFPCWESGFGCQTPFCARKCQSDACMYRAGMR